MISPAYDNGLLLYMLLEEFDVVLCVLLVHQSFNSIHQVHSLQAHSRLDSLNVSADSF